MLYVKNKDRPNTDKFKTVSRKYWGYPNSLFSINMVHQQPLQKRPICCSIHLNVNAPFIRSHTNSLICNHADQLSVDRLLPSYQKQAPWDMDASCSHTAQAQPPTRACAMQTAWRMRHDTIRTRQGGTWCTDVPLPQQCILWWWDHHGYDGSEIVRRWCRLHIPKRPPKRKPSAMPGTYEAGMNHVQENTSPPIVMHENMLKDEQQFQYKEINRKSIMQNKFARWWS